MTTVNGHELTGPHDHYHASQDKIEEKSRYLCSKCGELFHRETVHLHRDLIEPCQA